ncbi:MAG: hypothetical protein AB8G18_02115 [Gammaproteobacteria bacterium]
MTTGLIPIARLYFASALFSILIVCSPLSHAAVPDGISYQAYLTNNDGSPVDATVSISFVAYNVDIGGAPLWSQTQSVTVEQGLFSLTLGNPANPFPAGLFDNTVYIGMFVAGEELLPRRALSTGAYAFKANDADTVDGADAADLDQSADVTALQSDLSGVEGSVSAVLSDVSAVQADVASNDGRITALEVSGGDITGVVAGAGLIGGGSAGNVSLGIAPGGVMASMLGSDSVSSAALQTGSVGSAQIADGAVRPVDLNNSSDYTVRGLRATGNVDLTGRVIFDSINDIRIHDDANGLRWYKTDGVTQMASIVVTQNDVRLTDVNQDRPVIRSNSIGIAIGDSSATSGYAVTVPSLNVTGPINVGRTTVTTIFDVSSTTAQCHSHGNLSCFFGSGSATCPVGTTVVGGGTSAGTARYGSVSHSFPIGDSGWFCGVSYDLETSRNCYAICARVQ